MSIFAKRHYEAIAQAMQQAKYGTNSADQMAAVDRAISEVARVFSSDNGRFDRGRFERACVPGANVKARA